jgi:hypothetical protein
LGNHKKSNRKLPTKSKDSSFFIPFYGVSKIGAETTFMTSPHWVWILGIEYAVGSITGGWGYTEGEGDNVDTEPAIWDSKMGPSPTINPSGLFLTVGIRFLNF